MVLIRTIPSCLLFPVLCCSLSQANWIYVVGRCTSTAALHPVPTFYRALSVGMNLASTVHDTGNMALTAPTLEKPVTGSGIGSHDSRRLVPDGRQGQTVIQWFWPFVSPHQFITSYTHQASVYYPRYVRRLVLYSSSTSRKPPRDLARFRSHHPCQNHAARPRHGT